ncbi:hypothetical protein [Mesorhizobium sp. M7A.F.Ca.US.008.03.1.1]|uniref:hypothetical protein n=1 Tax=Mesorhizobium sp. M7A.F.Ca.US.008.03.1.1 TaxID=2496742 RepID=UPI000FCC6FF9|nr:hypothetical protein [Mesorhizobium sp. M7A.F.Ca.US.008.03.1.1]RUW63372.1 hypothetical protein EOA16_04445 [Mesorhizobium sp. M7A.F.Ca.US.008.03.1.1]
MTKARITSATPAAENEPYDAAVFARKYGMSRKAAEVVLSANGPSRTACDAAARSFMEAVARRAKSSHEH